MFKNTLIVTALIVLAGCGKLSAQADTLFLDLREVLRLAVENSLELATAESFYEENRLNILRLRQLLKPRLSAFGTLPNLSRAIELRPLPDGRDAYVNRSTMRNALGMSLDYRLIATGGTLKASTRLDRLDIFKTDQFGYSRTYFVNPISVSYTQPFFRFNETKWEKARFELLDAELTARQAVVREEVLASAIGLYNNMYQAQIAKVIAGKEITETDLLLATKRRLADIGKVLKVEMLQLELDQSSNQNNLERAELNLYAARIALADFLQIDRSRSIFLANPPDVTEIKIDVALATRLARENDYVEARNALRLADAEADIQRTQKDNGLEVSINASLGLNATDPQLSQLYPNLVDQQTLAVSINVPLTDGKARQLNREIAATQLFREQLEIQRMQNESTRNVRIAIRELELITKNIAFERRSQETAEEIYELTRRQYTAGSLGVNELNLANDRRRASQRNYYRLLLEATATYYKIRRLCMYDFVNQRGLID